MKEKKKRKRKGENNNIKNEGKKGCFTGMIREKEGRRREKTLPLPRSHRNPFLFFLWVKWFHGLLRKDNGLPSLPPPKPSIYPSKFFGGSLRLIGLQNGQTGFGSRVAVGPSSSSLQSRMCCVFVCVCVGTASSSFLWPFVQGTSARSRVMLPAFLFFSPLYRAC